MMQRLLMLAGLLNCFGIAVAQTEADEFAVLQTFDSWNQGWMEGDAELARL
jgi:hypothetical protein